MPAAFLHGVETFEILKGPRPIKQVKSAVIGLIGTAPVHHSDDPATLNVASLVLSDRDNAKFGPDLSGYSIPRALQAIQDQGAGTVLVINVFDPATHKTTVAATSRNITNKKVTLPQGDIIAATVTTSADAACVAGTDYTIDKVTGVITILAGGNLAAAATCKVAHSYGNPGAVVADDIVGETDGVTGVRSGAQAFRDCAALFGYGPKILIAPGFSSLATVRAALRVLAQPEKLRAIVLADVPSGTTRDDAIEGRGPSGAVDLQDADDRVFYLFPHLKVEDLLEPFSQRMAGVIAATDNERGYWHSPSNKEILGITGIEVPLTAQINDASSDVNALNEAGIVTVFSGYGISPRVWGNRASSFPASSDITTFMSVRRTIDMVDESVELATLRYQDGPVTKVLIDAVLEDVNAFLRTLISRGALMPGSRIEYFEEDNPPEALAAGHITFTKTMCPPPPAERITYKSTIDTTLLKV